MQEKKKAKYANTKLSPDPSDTQTGQPYGISE